MGYFGSTLQHELEQAGHKPTKQERQAKAAREKILRKYFGEEKGKPGFSDPAAMFG